MKNQEMLSLIKEQKMDFKELKVIRRRIPLIKDYLKSDKAKKHVNAINRMIYFYKNFETRIELKKGDVFTANFEFMCGNELNGSHFVIALLDSSAISQVVLIVPLHSLKQGYVLNPASDLLLGTIPGIANGKESIAIINQIRVIDKRRMFDKAAIEHFNQYIANSEYKDYHLITAQHKPIYRLTDNQFKKLHQAVQQYVFNGYIKH